MPRSQVVQRRIEFPDIEEEEGALSRIARGQEDRVHGIGNRGIARDRAFSAEIGREGRADEALGTTENVSACIRGMSEGKGQTRSLAMPMSGELSNRVRKARLFTSSLSSRKCMYLPGMPCSEGASRDARLVIAQAVVEGNTDIREAR